MDNNADFLVKFNSPRLGYGNVVLQNPSFTAIPAGVSIILGPNGAGKSTLGLVIEKGRYAYGNRLEFFRPDVKVKMLAFTDIHALTGIEVTRYDQRLEATVNDLVPTVGEILGEKASTQQWKELCDTFLLHDVVDKRVNYLSSGELRKLLIINALIDTPDILILDNPYIGLDAQSRAELDNAISGIAGSGTGIIMLLCDAIDIPAYTTAIITLDNHTLSRPIINPEKIANLREIGRAHV